MPEPTPRPFSQLPPPPDGFQAAGDVEWAELSWTSPWGAGADPRPSKGARAAGLAYERKVHRHFGALFAAERGAGTLYAPAQWIRFRSYGSRRIRWAQPDGLLLDFGRGLVTVVEVKLKHTSRTWWWVRQLYTPLLRYIFPAAWHFAWLEVVRFYEPDVAWPEGSAALRMVREPTALRAGQFGCHIYTKG